MKQQIQLIILLLFYSNIFGQNIQVVSQGIESDSSFYHIEKINENEFWVAGECGILKKIDSLGNVSSQNFPNEGLDILKIVKKENYIFIITNNALIYRYDIKKKIFIKNKIKTPKFFTITKSEFNYKKIKKEDKDLLKVKKGEKVIDQRPKQKGEDL